MFFILVIIIALTFNSIYDKGSLKIIESSIKNISFYYVIIGLFIILFYFVLQGIYMKCILKKFNKNISLKKGTFYSLIEFYFSGITPSSVGGQPVQLYYMTKDKIPIKTSYIVLVLNAICFKLVLLTLSILVLIFNSNYIFNNNTIYIIFFIIGFISDLIMVFIGIMLLSNKKLIKRILTFFYKIGMRFKVFRKKRENKSIDSIIKNYDKELSILKNNKKTLLIAFIITFVQRIALFSVAYVVYRALGFSKYNYFDLLAIQVSVQTAVEMLPLPGGAYLSENMFFSIFKKVFNTTYANIGMLLTRMFSFYIPLLGSGLIILIYSIIVKRKKENNIVKEK